MTRPLILLRLLLVLLVVAGLHAVAIAQDPTTPDAGKTNGSDNTATKDEANGKDKEKNGDEQKDKDKDDDKPKWYSAHAQGTVVSQGNGSFRSPYAGEHSLLPGANIRTSETATLFLAGRMWCGGEFIFNPEIAGGRGLSQTQGMAGFPNGEITRVGKLEPTPYIARAFFRQTIGLGGEQEKVEDEANQIAGTRDVDRITISIGKFAATDIVDDNRYSHDPRTQFLNWSLMYNGAWDYPANTRGYTYGLGIDFNQKTWAFRYAILGEPTVANGEEIDPRFLNAQGHVWELEERYDINEHPGKVRLLAYLNHAHMGNYREAVRDMPVDPDITLTRTYRIKYGFGINWEQELTKDLGFFCRAGWNDGQSESWAFTEIDMTIACGMLMKGTCWRRPNDQVGMALVANGISSAHRDYLAAGGLGFIIGDGQLRYGPEEIMECYYNLELAKGINVAADFQAVNNPAYNRDRGPVAIGAVRVHFAY